NAGGDTNADRNQTTQASGDWNTLFFDAKSTGNLLNHVLVRYGGSDQAAEVRIAGDDVTFSNSTFSSSNTGGLRVDNSAPTLNADTFADNKGAAVIMNLAAQPDICHPSVRNNGLNGVDVIGGTI